MTEKEAINRHIRECIRRIRNIKEFSEMNKSSDAEGCAENIYVLKTAIYVLKQCRAIGTVEECRAAVDKYTRMTNADRIRAMSDEELAEFLVNVEAHGYYDQSISGTLDMIDWLQSEVEDKE